MKEINYKKMEVIYRLKYQIKCPYCGCYVEPVLMADEVLERVIIVCPNCKMQLSVKDLEGEEEDEDD
mgnify:FL=1